MSLKIVRTQLRKKYRGFAVRRVMAANRLMNAVLDYYRGRSLAYVSQTYMVSDRRVKKAIATLTGQSLFSRINPFKSIGKKEFTMDDLKKVCLQLYHIYP